MVADLHRFEGWRKAWTPPDRRPIYEWAHEHISLSSAYAIQGRFDVSLSRPLMAVFDDIANPRIHRIRFRKPPRFGGSLVADIAIPWIVCNDPGPVMWNWQTDADAKAHMQEKAWEVWRACKPFKALLPRNRHSQTKTEIYFGPFFFVAQGANLSNLQSKGIRWLFNDEVWLPVWQELYQHALYRTRDFERSGAYKVTDVSQAGSENDVEDRNWNSGHQAVWGYRSPVDGKLYPLSFGGQDDAGRRWGFLWNDDARRPDGSWNKARAIETVRYRCRFTGYEWPDGAATREAWNRDGDYIVTHPDAPADSRSYAVNALLNYSMVQLAADKIEALEQANRGDMAPLRDFTQKSVCQPWKETFLTVTIRDAKSGYLLADYANGQRWDGEIHRAITIDRQHGFAGDVPHRWVEIRAYRPGGASRQLWFGRVESKEECRRLQNQYGVPDRCVWQDARYERHKVYEESVEYGWLAVVGSDRKTWKHIARNSRGQIVETALPYSGILTAGVPGTGGHARYLEFSEQYMDDILGNLVAGRGVPFEHAEDVPAAYLEHLQGEHKKEVRPGVFRWEKIHSTKPNHGWDTSKMQIAFACVLKLMALPETRQNAEAA